MRTSSTHDSLRATFQVTASVLSPCTTEAADGYSSRSTPTDAVCPWERETAAEHRRLGSITRSSSYRRPHPTFQVGRQGERAI